LPFLKARYLNEESLEINRGGSTPSTSNTMRSRHQRKYISMRLYAHMRTCRWFFTSTLNKITQKIGRKHRTPSEKEKKWNVKSVPTSIVYVFHLYAQRNHSLTFMYILPIFPKNNTPREYLLFMQLCVQPHVNS